LLAVVDLVALVVVGQLTGLVCDEHPAEDEVCEGVRNLPSASRSVCTYCFIVKATSAWPMRLDSAFQSIFAFRPAIA
jgi:hypothetical protein